MAGPVPRLRPKALAPESWIYKNIILYEYDTTVHDIVLSYLVLDHIMFLSYYDIYIYIYIYHMMIYIYMQLYALICYVCINSSNPIKHITSQNGKKRSHRLLHVDCSRLIVARDREQAKIRSKGSFMVWNRRKAKMPTRMGVSENVVYYPKPNGFADHYPVFKWLFHWEY